MCAQPYNEPPADLVIHIDDAKPEQDTWYSSGDTATMTTGDSRVVEHKSDAPPQLVGRTEGGPTAAPPSSPFAYDWRTDTDRGHSAHPFGSPQDGDTFTRDGDAYHTVGGGAVLQPIDMITRWLDQMPGRLNGATRSEAQDDFVNYMRPVVSPIPHNNRWERAAVHYAAMDLARDGVIRISTPSARRDRMMVPYRAGPQSEVYDGGGTRLSAYTPSPHDIRPSRHFDISIARYRPQPVPAENDMEQEDDGGGRYPPGETFDSLDNMAATQSPDSVDNLE